MRKPVMVCLCTALFLVIPFTSLVASPQPLVPEHRRVTPIPNGDPDGPYEGGLDDPTDWINLLGLIGNLLIIPGFILSFYYVFSQQQGLISFAMTLLYFYWTMRYGVYQSFAEAFDRGEFDGDGC